VIDNNGDLKSLNKKTKEVMSYIHHIEPEDFSRTQAAIPTKSGYHLITTPFNLQQFKEKYPDIDVHKNNSTLLYYL
jgi:hypothetical protein